MNIAFDGKRAIQNYTGLGNYSRYVIEALVKYGFTNQYTIFAPRHQENKRLAFIEQQDCIKFSYPKTRFGKLMPSLWRTFGIKNDIVEQSIDIYHGLSNELPLNIRKCKNTKSIVTMHDLIYRRLPKCYKFFDRKIYDYKYRRSCQNADMIIAVSECTKRDIVDLYNISPNKIKVIYQGCDSIFATQKSNDEKVEVRNRLKLPPRYILSVGSIEERKNALTIVKTLPILPQDIHLVLVGKYTPYVDQIIEYAHSHNIIDRLHVLHNVTYSDLPTLYQCAEVFVYPSVYEGFGIPILEALNSRVPVVAATGSCLEEAGGPSSLYVSPFDDKSMAEAIKLAMEGTQHQKMVDDGALWATRFTQERLAQQTMECYESLLAKC